MSTDRTRVVPPIPGTGYRLASLLAAFGVIHGAAFVAADHYGLENLVRSLGPTGPWHALLMLAPIALPPLVIAFLITRRTQRWRRVTIAIAAWMASMATWGLIFAGLSARWPMRLHPAESLDPSTLLLVAMAGAYGALCGVLAITLSRRFLFVVAEQSGSLCWRCGYDLGAASISVCPECGTQAAPAHFRLARPIRLFDRLARRGRVFLIMLAVSAGAWCTSRVFTRVIPTYQFYSAFGGWGQPGDPGHTWLYVPSGRTPSGLWDGAAACLPFDDDPSRGLIVAYWPGGPPGAPRGIRMRIQYVQMPQPAAMPAGAPPVCAIPTRAPCGSTPI